MKLNAEIEGEKTTVEVRREGGRVVAEVAGRSYELEAREIEEGEYLLLFDRRVFECRVSRAIGSHDAGQLQVALGADTYDVTLGDPRRLRGGQGAAGADAGRAQLTAPMPGRVVRVMVEQGQEVEAGQGVVVVEAMKMQNELKSPRAGTIAELRAAEGTNVNAGDVLAVIE
jgi:biotin carboxyl carrier protein